MFQCRFPVLKLTSKRKKRFRLTFYFKALLTRFPATLLVNEHLEIVFANMQVTALFGYASDELAGSDIEVLLPERYRNSHRQHQRGYFPEPVVRLMGSGSGLYGLRKDGTEFPVDISLSPLRTAQGLMVICSIRESPG